LYFYITKIRSGFKEEHHVPLRRSLIMNN